MLKYLKQLSKIDISLILTKRIGNKSFNSAIFGERIPTDLKKYKFDFFKKLNQKKEKLEIFENKIKKSNIFSENTKKILLKEIFVKLKKIEFLKKVYDVEANKLDSNYKIKYEIEDYDHYNKIFYGVDKTFLDKKIIISKNKEYDIFISKEKLIELLEFSKKIVPELKWDLGNFNGLAHNNGILKIPNQEEYNIKRIIVIFFHEMTHFFRYLSGKNNLGFNYTSSNYDSLEEGIATYNEYYYGNKIIDYGKYNAYYDKCYQVLLKDISEKEKKEKIFNILKNKGFDKEKTNGYYYRFYRYTKIGGKKLFLKDLIYSSAYSNVIKLLNENKKNYGKIMAGRIGLIDLKNNLIKKINNVNSKKYFKTIEKEIKKII